MGWGPEVEVLEGSTHVRHSSDAECWSAERVEHRATCKGWLHFVFGELFEGDTGSDALPKSTLYSGETCNIVFAQSHISLQRPHAATTVSLKLNISFVL